MGFSKSKVFAFNIKHKQARFINCRSFILGWFLLCIIIGLDWIATDANAQEIEQIFNRQNIFKQMEECDAHTEFLRGQNAATPESCHLIATFQIENQHLNDTIFLLKFYKAAGQGSALGALALATQAAVSKVEPIYIYSYADLADQRISISLAESFDIERAALYTLLLSDVKRIALLSLCDKTAKCNRLRAHLPIGENFGDKFSFIEEVDPSFTLNCLLRSDSFLIPVRDVLSSFKFKECLTTRNNLLQNKGQ